MLRILGAIDILRRTSWPGLNACLASVRYWNPDAQILVFNRSSGNEMLSGLLARHGVTSIPWEPRLNDSGVGIGRFVEYGRYLETRPNPDPLILIDLLDVVAQGPWSSLAPGVFEENKVIGDCPYNATWIRSAFPQEMVRMAQETVICCGAIVGTYEWTLAYLQAYTRDGGRQRHQATRPAFPFPRVPVP